jgi:hypothetical protein
MVRCQSGRSRPERFEYALQQVWQLEMCLKGFAALSVATVLNAVGRSQARFSSSAGAKHLDSAVSDPDRLLPLAAPRRMSAAGG